MDETISKILSIAAYICVVALGFTIERLRRYSKANTLKEWVAWCVTSDSHLYRSGLHLRDYVKNAQLNLQISQKYRISGDEEWKYTREILLAYQNELTKDYFEGKLSYIKGKYEIPGELYFMLSLALFLEKHQNDYEICGHPMRITSPDACQKLSAFGMVYYKLYYIAGTFCHHSKIIDPKGNRFYSKSAIEEALDACAP